MRKAWPVALALLLLMAPVLCGAQGGLAASRFTSNLYTQPEPASFAGPAGQSASQLESHSAGQPLPASYRRAASTEELELWVDPAGLSVAVVDRRGAGTWRATTSVSASAGLNDTWRANLSSGIILEYVDQKEVLATESSAGGPAAIDLRLVPGGFDANCLFPASGISVLVEARLDRDSLVMRVPAAGIHEGGASRLVSIRLLPFLGAVRGAEVPGYVLIPDGSGALMRFRAPDTRSGSAWSEPVFGADLGVSGVPPENESLVRAPQPVTLPVFGIARPVGRAAFIAAVEEGAAFSTIDATPAGVTTDFSWACARFIYRRQFFQPTSKALGGITIFQKTPNAYDATIRWMFLAGPAADYVGMARRYQARLVERGLLQRRPVPAASDVPVFLQFLGADWRPGLLAGRRVVPATTAGQLTEIVDDLRGRGVTEIVAGYRGYQKGGASGAWPLRFPAERLLGGDAGLQRAARHLADAGIPLALEVSYTAGFTGRVSARTDAARELNGQPLASGDLLFLSPRKALSLAASDIRDLPRRSITAVLVPGASTRLLFSDFGAGYPRDKAAAAMTDLSTRLRGAGIRTWLSSPNEYLLAAADGITDLPRYPSLHVFETDSVPFVQIVLKGYVEYFSSPSNFIADPTEELLRSLDYGSSPSFLLTAVPSRDLVETGSSDLFTTWYPDWRDRIVREYTAANQALKMVRGLRIQGRVVPRPGVAVVQYEGGTSVVVNYTDAPFTWKGATAAARGFAVARAGVPEDAHAAAR